MLFLVRLLWRFSVLWAVAVGSSAAVYLMLSGYDHPVRGSEMFGSLAATVLVLGLAVATGARMSRRFFRGGALVASAGMLVVLATRAAGASGPSVLLGALDVLLVPSTLVIAGVLVWALVSSRRERQVSSAGGSSLRGVKPDSWA